MGHGASARNRGGASATLTDQRGEPGAAPPTAREPRTRTLRKKREGTEPYVPAHRAAAVGPEEAEALADGAPLASTLLEDEDDRRRLEGCIDQLDPRHAGALRTAFFEGVTYDALAQALKVPLGTMKSWIRRSLISLRGCLEA